MWGPDIGAINQRWQEMLCTGDGKARVWHGRAGAVVLHISTPNDRRAGGALQCAWLRPGAPRGVP